MSYSFSVISPASPAPLVPAPPPLPAVERGGSGGLFDDADEDMRRLTADITRVLSGRPDLRVVGTRPDGPGPAEASMAVAGDDDAIDPFEWQASELPGAPRATTDAAGWLSRAKRDRGRERLRTAGSWCVSLGIVGVIIAGVAGSVPGGALFFSALDEIRRATGL